MAACQIVNRVDNAEADMNVPKQHFVKSHARVRFIHNDMRAGPVNVILGDMELLTNLGYQAITDYIRVRSGDRTLTIVSGGGSFKKPLKMGMLSVKPDMVYTVIIQGTAKKMDLISIVDDAVCGMEEMRSSKIRFIHAAAEVPPVDIWSGNQNKIFSDVKYVSATPYEEIPPENVQINVTLAGDNNVVLGPINMVLDAGRTYTVIASGIPGAVSAMITVDTDCNLLNA